LCWLQVQPSQSTAGSHSDRLSNGVPDLQLQLMFAPSPATTSQPILLTATVRNRTQQTAQLPVLDLVLPSDAGVTQLLTPGWQCQQTELLLRCQRDSFAGGDSNDLSFVLQPSQAASQLSVTAAVSSQDEDCDPSNNQAAAVVTIERVDSQARAPGIAGGGFGCSVTAHPHAGPGRFGWAPVLLAWLCSHVQRRRRQLPRHRARPCMSPQSRHRQRRTARLSGLLGLLLGIGGTQSRAEAQNQGFALSSYDPPAAGQPALAVAQPYYSARLTWAAGLTLSYGHSPLVFGVRTPAGIFSAESPLIAHQLQGFAEVSVSFLQRVQLSLTLPVDAARDGDAALRSDPGAGHCRW
jgi:hypothetical protein